MRIVFLSIGFAFCNGCAVVAVADAAVTVVATTVKVGAAVVGTTVDVAAAGVRAVAGNAEDENWPEVLLKAANRTGQLMIAGIGPVLCGC